MMEALVVSNTILWILVCGLCVVVAALTRQVGLLHERIAPAGALAIARGPEVGDASPVLTEESLDGKPVQLGGVDGSDRPTLLFFLSPTCPVCATLLPTLERIVRAQDTPTRIVYASDGPRAEHEAFSKEKGIAQDAYILSRPLGLSFEVSKLPYAVLIDAGGSIRAKGLVNTREHIESLFEADRLGVASLQEYLAKGAA